ncbi:MFS transporter [Alteromonas halophila]|uniref:Major facilitator superfamily (MFS) profile domain-containing protein n=1 Tax=Alteromonas halophila TaxID=516698 RepID=A0A918N0P0_9ALTE|nr:MFS transporter [Alteromonas halophila]GGW90689.1 hypothetical protein GCM10007391_26190 [Alteromonas halophila]
MQRRPVTVVVFAGFFLLGNLFILWGILLPDIARNLAMSELVSGALFSLFSLGMMIGAILGGKYANRYDFVSLLGILFALDAVSVMVMTHFTHWSGVIGMAFIIGIISSAIITIGHTLIAQIYAQKRFAMMGLMDFMFSLGTLAASFFVTLMYQVREDWHLPMQVLSFIMLGVAALAFFTASANARKVATSAYNQDKRTLAFTQIIRQPVFMFMALLSFGYGAVEFGNANWFVSYAHNGHGFSGEQSRNLLACFTAGMVISRLGFAWLLRIVSVPRLIVLMATMSLMGTLGIKLSSELVSMGASNLLLGLGLGGLFPLMLSAAMSMDEQNGPVLSGISIIGNSTGVQVASFSTGVWANYVPLTVAFWVIPIAGCWLWLAAVGYSKMVRQGQ